MLLRFVLVALAVLAIQSADAQIYELPNPVAVEGDYFGSSVAISGEIAVVGASGVNECGVRSGAVYVYVFDERTGHWVQTDLLVPDPCEPESSFGRTVAIDDSVVVVSSFRETALTAESNSAYVFELQRNGDWVQTQRLRPDVSTDEGAYASYVDVHDGLIAVATTGDTSTRKYGGSVYLYRKSGGVWTRSQRLVVDRNKTNGIFGGRVGIGHEFIAVTSPAYAQDQKGSLHIFEKDDSGAFSHRIRFDGLDDFFLSLAVDSASVIVGEKTDGDDDSGSATVFLRDEKSRWSRKQILRPANPFELGAFGTDVATADGLILVVGYDEQLQFEYNIDRVVYVFDYQPDGGYWQQRHIIDVGDVFFGASLDIDERIAIIGKASDTTVGSAVIVHLN